MRIDELLQKAVDLSVRVGYAVLATTGEQAMPHVTAVGRLSHPAPGQVAVDEWFCPGTTANLSASPANVSVVVWDPQADTGYQLLGQVENLTEQHVMNGYLPGRTEAPLPQVQQRLVVQITEILLFSLAPHSDQPVDVRT